MEMASTDSGNLPKSYSLNMFKDFVPMSVFSETNQGEDLNSGSLKYLIIYVSFCGFSTHGLTCGTKIILGVTMVWNIIKYLGG